jgi:hypothetical protein
MELWIRILYTIIFSIIATIVLFNIENSSNFSSFIMIPLIVALLTKYILGDWDSGFRWTMLDIPYWITIVGSSYIVIYMISQK